jgi:putative glycosyltransferase
MAAARLMTSRYVSSLIEHSEREVFLAGLYYLTGYVQVGVPIRKRKKHHSTYTLGRKLDLWINSITSFTNKPLVYICYLGIMISIMASLGVVVLATQAVVTGEFLIGWPSVIVSVWLLGGLTILCLGVIGLYVSKVFIETKQRPYTIVREVYERSGVAGTGANDSGSPRERVHDASC